jgi:hypothetical protein
MNSLVAEPTVSILDLNAQMLAREHAAYEREVDASIARGLTQARDANSKKYTLSEIHEQVSQTIEQIAKRVAHA